jgi:hypothetical protein
MPRAAATAISVRLCALASLLATSASSGTSVSVPSCALSAARSAIEG